MNDNILEASKTLQIKSSLVEDLEKKVSTILSEEAKKFLLMLHHQFEDRRKECLKEREETKKAINHDNPLNFLKNTEKIRSDANWKVAPIPKDLEKRYVEITGPTDAKMMINALNSGADVFMADFEDANSPTWKNLIEGQLNLNQAINNTLTFKSAEGKEYYLNDKTAVIMVRPRGLHLVEKHALINDFPMSASLFDFGLAFFHNAKALIEKGSGPYYYLPKIEHYKEARLWNDIFNFSEDFLKIPQGTIRATVLIETIFAAFQMEEILYELKSHSAGLNAGRWDYIFSILKNLINIPLMPDRSQISMTTSFMKAYNILLIHTCHKRKISAIGGMAAYIPSRKDAQINENALNLVKNDKIRESTLGFDGTWVAHPDLVPIARDVFEKALKGKPNQLNVGIDVNLPTSKDLIDFTIPDGKITEDGLRQNISVTLQYLGAWLQGIGAVAINNLMEDAATAEISNAELWHWLHYRQAKLNDGRKITKELYRAIAGEELDAIYKNLKEKDKFSYYQKAQTILDNSTSALEPTRFLTLLAYEHLDNSH